MNQEYIRLVDPNQHNPPAIYPGELTNRNVILNNGVRREVPVLTVHIVGGVQMHYVLGLRTIKLTKYGRLVFGQQLQNISNSSDLLLMDVRIAVKVSELPKVRNQIENGLSTENPLHEIAAMQIFGPDHPHLMGQYVSCIQGDLLYTMMPYLECEELFDYMNTRLSGGFPEREARHIFQQVVVGVRDLHHLQIAHRDISLENVLLCLDPVTRAYNMGRAVLIDLGMCYRSRPDVPPPPTYPRAHYGKSMYIPPEALANIDNPLYRVDPRAFDIWACGCLLFLLLTRIPLFEIALPSESTGRYIFLHSNPASGLALLLQTMEFPPLLVDLLSQMLRLDPSQRISADAVLAHPWMQAPL